MRDLVVVLVIAACAGCAAAEPAPPPPPAPMANPRAPILTIRQLTFIDDGKPRIRLTANGGIELVVHHVSERNSTLQDRFAGTLLADGSFADAHGTTAGNLHADGTFTMMGAGTFKLDGDTLVVGDRRLAIDDRGMLVENGKAAASTIHIEGAVDAGTRRTALLVFAIANSVSLHDRDPFCDYVVDDVNPNAPALAGASKLAIEAEDVPIVAADHDRAAKLRIEAGRVAAVETGLAARHYNNDAVASFNHDFVAMLHGFADSMTRLADASDRGDRAAWDAAVAQEKTARATFSELGRTIIVRTGKTCRP